MSQVHTPAGGLRRPAARGTRLPAVRSSTTSATNAAITHSTPSTITASLSAVGVVMNRVSTSMRAVNPASGPTSKSVKTPATCGRLSGSSVPVAPGMPTKSAPTAPTLAQMRSSLHAPEATSSRGATAATLSRNAT